MSRVFISAENEISDTVECFLNEIPGSEFVGKSADALQIPARIAILKPEIMLIHHKPPFIDSAQLVLQCREILPELRCLILLSNEEDFWSALAARANGYVHWPTTWLPQAIDTIMNGSVWLGPVITDYLLRGDGYNRLQQFAAPDSGSVPEILSPREKEVINLLTQGLQNQEIADALGLSVGTIKVHVKHILEKLKLKHRSQVIARYARSQAS